MKLKEKTRDINDKFEKKIISFGSLIDLNELEYNPFVPVFFTSFFLVTIGFTFFNNTITIIFCLFGGLLLIIMLALFIDYIDLIYYTDDMRRKKPELYCKICKEHKRIRKILLSLGGNYSTYKLVCEHKYNIKVVHVKEYCRICSSKLHFRNYPEKFPDKFKICCFCLNTAKYIFSDKKSIFGLHRMKKRRYKTFKEKFDKLFIIKTEV